jgi:hypothetical protein
VTGSAADTGADSTYAEGLANTSYEWYKSRAIRSRRLHRIVEVGVLVIGAAIPTAAVIAPDDNKLPAILGALVIVASGLRAIFHWQENFVRFSQAREAVEAERRAYRLRNPPYGDGATRESELAAAITRIEQQEMRGWVELAIERPKTQGG